MHTKPFVARAHASAIIVASTAQVARIASALIAAVRVAVVVGFPTPLLSVALPVIFAVLRFLRLVEAVILSILLLVEVLLQHAKAFVASAHAITIVIVIYTNEIARIALAFITAVRVAVAFALSTRA